MTMAARLRAPGWYRVALAIPIGIAFAFGLDVLIRSLMHYHPATGVYASENRPPIRFPLNGQWYVYCWTGQNTANQGFDPLRPTCRPKDHA